MHKSRSNRNQKAIRLKNRRYAMQLRLGDSTEQERAAERAKEKQERYPVPPVYRYKDSDPQPTQPACYTVWFNPFQRYGRV